MNNLSKVIALFMAIPTIAHTVEYTSGHLNCKILESFQMKVEDGRSTTYNYYPVGEPLRLEFSASKSSDFEANMIIRNTIVNHVEVPLEKFEDLGVMVLGEMNPDSFNYVGDGYLALSNSVTEMDLFKYASTNAWHGIAVGNFYKDYEVRPNGVARHVYSVNCESGDATLQKFFEEMRIIINS